MGCTLAQSLMLADSCVNSLYDIENPFTRVDSHEEVHSWPEESRIEEARAEELMSEGKEVSSLGEEKDSRFDLRSCRSPWAS
jgi:hypothetical protein